MNPLLLIHGYSAESRKTDAKSIARIYGSLPSDLRARYGPGNVFELDVSRYISLEDGVRLDDVSRAMDRALRDRYSHLLDARFDIVIHSTGALVARNWLRRHSRKPSPVDRLVYLAGANFGSGWAHIGRGQLAKWGRQVFQGGAERGVQILNALELGSSETLDLHLHFLEPSNDIRSDYGVREFCLIGSQVNKPWLRIPVRYAHEDGSDGVVRVSACNTNFNYVPIVPKQRAADVGWQELMEQRAECAKPLEDPGRNPGQYYRAADPYLADEELDPPTPLGILYECAHSGDKIGVVTGSGPRKELLSLLDIALGVSSDARYRQAQSDFERHTDATYAKAATELAPGWFAGIFNEPRRQYDAHAQIIFRLRDQDGRPIEHFDVLFHTPNANTNEWAAEKPRAKQINELFEHTHRNAKTEGIVVFYLRVTTFDKDRKKWVDELDDVDGADLEIVPTEPQTGEIAYLPCRLVVSRDRLKRFIRPHQSTLVDVWMPRWPSEEVFRVATAADG